MSVSIKDIAKAAGVSHSTVSRALRHSPLVNEETAAHIRSLAREMGYTPSAVARSLVSQRTETIGLVVTSISDPFVDRIVDGVEDLATSAGYGVFLGSSHADPEREMGVVGTFHRHRVDGVIVLASRVGQLYSERLRELNVPIVLINNEAEGQYLYSVAVDDEQGARLAVQHLLGLGHQRIGYIGSASRQPTSLARQAGYAAELLGAGLAVEDCLVVVPDVGDDVLSGSLGLDLLLAQGVTAIFCYNDRTAIGALLQAHERGVAVPRQLSLVGFDNIDATQYVTPPLTTVAQPRFEMGQIAMQMLLDLLDKREVRNRHLPCKLVVRGSTARARKSG